MSTSLTKEEKKEQKRKTTNVEELDKNTLINTLNNRTKGLSVAIDNRVLEHYAKPLEEQGKAFKMKHISRLFSILISNKKNQLNSYVPFEAVADLLDLNTNVSTNRLKSDVRKALRELYPTIEFKEDPVKGIKFTHIPKEPNEGYYIEKSETRGFTQLYCDLAFVTHQELIVLFTVLEYFKGSSKEIYPSINTIMSLCGCRKRDKINKLLKEGEQVGLWKIISTKGGSKKHTNRYELSYITQDGKERYYYLDVLEKDLINSLDMKKEQIV